MTLNTNQTVIEEMSKPFENMKKLEAEMKKKQIG